MKNKHPYYYGAGERIFKNAKRLRKESTPAEKILWEILRNRQVFKLKFRRQHPIGRYVADFYCHEINLVIELDGLIHEQKEIKQYDQERQKHLEDMGIRVIRFGNQDAISSPECVIDAVRKFLPSSLRGSPHEPALLPEGEG